MGLGPPNKEKKRLDLLEGVSTRNLTRRGPKARRIFKTFPHLPNGLLKESLILLRKWWNNVSQIIQKNQPCLRAPAGSDDSILAGLAPAGGISEAKS